MPTVGSNPTFSAEWKNPCEINFTSLGCICSSPLLFDLFWVYVSNRES
jgi:hypothetical protein